MINKKGQNEIVGFVMIVVIVVLIGLFLLVFYLRGQDTGEIQSKNVENFLKASLYYTTSCRENLNLADIRELAKKCYSKEQCEEEKDSCSLLNETYSQLLKEAWRIDSSRPENYYNLNIYYLEKSSEDEGEARKEEILALERGNCTGTIIGAEEFFRQGEGNIYLKLKVCSI